MPKFLFQGSYYGDGLKGLAAEGGTSRVEAARKLFSSLGGTLEHFYFAFSPENLVVICDLPDTEAAAAFSLAINNSSVAGDMSRVAVAGGDGPGDHPVARVPGARRS